MTLIRNYLVTIKMTLDRCFVWEILAENNAARKFTITSPFLLILLKYNTLIYTNKGTLKAKHGPSSFLHS